MGPPPLTCPPTQSTELCAEVKAMLDETFALLDCDKDGRLDWHEIRPFVVFNFKGRPVSEQQSKIFVEAFDSERKGSLSCSDYTKLIISGVLRDDSQRQLQC